MTRLKRILKYEIDVELTACLYVVCMGWLLCLFRFLSGADGLGFWPFTCLIVLAWAAAWFQKLLFWRQKPMSLIKERIRSLLWWLVPCALFSGAAAGLGWLADCPPWARWGFCAAATGTLLCWWICIRLICRDETEQWNEMLTQFKRSSEENKQ